MLENNIDMLQKAIDSLRKLAIGGTAVGTGLNTPQGFGDLVCERLSDQLATQFITRPEQIPRSVCGRMISALPMVR